MNKGWSSFCQTANYWKRDIHLGGYWLWMIHIQSLVPWWKNCLVQLVHFQEVEISFFMNAPGLPQNSLSQRQFARLKWYCLGKYFLLATGLLSSIRDRYVWYWVKTFQASFVAWFETHLTWMLIILYVIVFNNKLVTKGDMNIGE